MYTIIELRIVAISCLEKMMDNGPFPISVVFRHIDASTSIQDDVHQKALKLARFSDEIMHCQVIVEKHHNHQQAGNLYHVRIDLKTANALLVVDREPNKHTEHKDVYVAIRDAFAAIKRQLQNRFRSNKKQAHIHTKYNKNDIIAQVDRLPDVPIE